MKKLSKEISYKIFTREQGISIHNNKQLSFRSSHFTRLFLRDFNSFRSILTIVLALSVFTSNAQISTFPHETDFEAQASCSTGCGPTCALSTDWKNGSQLGFPADVDWTADAGGTSSSGTGPSVDHTVGTNAGKYIYAETSCSGIGYSSKTFDLYSPQYDFTAIANPVLVFWYHLFGGTTGNMQVDVSTDNWVSSTPLVAPFSDNANQWQASISDLTAYGGMSDVRLRIRYTSGTSFNGDAGLDDIQIIDGINPNLGLTEVFLDNPACTLTDAETVQYEILSTGFVDIPAGTSFDVSVSLNGMVQGTTTHTLSTPLLVGSSITETFSLPVDLATAGDYTITATVSIANDTNGLDDTASIDIASAGEISLPYLEDFENGPAAWQAVKITNNSTWELGTPANTTINSAASGDNAWITNANGNYNSNENGYVESPCFDLSETCGDPEMTVSIWWEAEFSWDGMVVQSSVDDGGSWQNVGGFQNPDPAPEDNWYTDNSINGNPGGQEEGWTGQSISGNGSNDWVTAAQELTGLGGNSNVVLRFAFASDGSVADDGVAFDDFAITNNRAVNIADVNVTGETCAGAADGTVTVNAITECGNVLTYSNDGGMSYQASNVFTGFSPGETTVHVKSDVSDYVASQTVTIEPRLIACDLDIVDPCACLNNASPININAGTGGEDGSFSEIVVVTGPGGSALSSGLTLSVIAPTTGVLDAFNVPIVGSQSSGTPVATDGSVTLVFNASNGHYELPFVHLDNIGYSITIEGPQAVGTPGNVILTIGNKCAYPNPVFSPVLDDLYCLNASSITLGGDEPNGADAVSFTVNGNAAATFDPTALGIGSHIVEMTYDGTADANGGNSPDGGTTAAITGCTQTVVQTIVVGDTEVPVAVCPAIVPVVMLNASGSGILAANALADGNSTDNCSVIETSPLTNYTCADIGTQMVTLTAMDGNTTPNTNTISCNVTVVDNIAPVAVCPTTTPVVMLDANGNGTLAANALAGGNSTDNCSVTETSPVTNYTCADVGTQMVTLTAMDLNTTPNTNTIDCSITVVDNIAPVALCLTTAPTIMLDANGNATLSVTDVHDSTMDADNCNAISLSLSQTSFSCADIGANTVTLTVTDANNNSDNCDATVTVSDSVLPTMLCQDATIILDASGNAAITTSDIDNGSNDACGIASLTLDNLDFGCENITPTEPTAPTSVLRIYRGRNVTFTNVNINGTGNNVLTVAPGAAVNVTTNYNSQFATNFCPGCLVQYYIGIPGEAIACMYDNLANSTFNGIGNLNFTAPTIPGVYPIQFTGSLQFSCTATADDLCDTPIEALGFIVVAAQNTVTLTATDVNGNSNTCTANVTVQDNIAPVANCPTDAPIIELNAAGRRFLSKNALVNGNSTDNCTVTESSIITLFECDAIGVQQVELLVFDEGGNTTVTNCDVIIQDNLAPDVITKDIIVELDNEGNVSITTADIDDGTTDACGIASMSLDFTTFSCGNVGPNTVNLTVTDVNGNTGSESAIVTVVDLLPAEIQCRQPVSTTVTPGACARIDLTVLPPFVLYDNCGINSGISIARTPAGNDFSVGTTTLIWTVTDSNGNDATCESLVIVQDNEAPTVGSCNTVIDFLEPNSCTAQVTVSVEASDNCGLASIEGAGTFSLPLGIHPRTITVTDVNGNVTLHDITIYVHDDQAPELVSCPEDIEIIANQGENTVDLPEPVFTDNCGIYGMTNDAPEVFAVGTTTVTFIGTDTYGNTIDCSYDVTITPSIFFTGTTSPIEASTEAEGESSMVTWNRPEAITHCEACLVTDMPDFIFLGEFEGHQYFLYPNATDWTEAVVLSEEINGQLVTVNDARENAFIQEQLPVVEDNDAQYWTGLSDEAGEFAWLNGAAFDFINFEYDAVIHVDSTNAAVMNTNGTWAMTTSGMENGFITERPCLDITQVAPIIETEGADGEIIETLLTPDADWGAGEYTVIYEATDMCDSTARFSFGVTVQEPTAVYCQTSGLDQDVWLESVVFNDYSNESENNAGYADYTEEAVELLGTHPVSVQLTPGGIDLEENETPLYWRIFADWNNDGDFFDANEILHEQTSTNIVNVDFPAMLNEADLAVRLRIAVAKGGYPEACADYTTGEAEDYALFFPAIEVEEGEEEGGLISIYPNPANSYVIIDLSDLTQTSASISISDNLGKVHYKQVVDAVKQKNLRIDLRDFDNGIYFVTITTSKGEVITGRLVVTKIYSSNVKK